MVAVGVGVRQDDDLAVAQLVDVEGLPEAAAERGHQVRQLLVLEHLGGRHVLGVQHLAAQRQDGLPAPVARLLGRAAGGVALDDEQLAVRRGPGRAVAQLAGQAEPRRGDALAGHLLLRRAARLARPRGDDDARHDGAGGADVVVQPVLERRPHGRVDRRRHLRIVQAVLGLALELRVAHEDAEHAREALADVVRGQRHPLRAQSVGLDEVAHRLADAGAQAGFVGAAGAGRHAVDVAAEMLVGRLRPLQHEVDARAGLVVVPAEGEDLLVHRRRAARADDVGQIVLQPLGVLEDPFLAAALVVEDDADSLVQVADDLQAFGNDGRIELGPGKYLRIGAEEHRGARPPGAAELPRPRHRPAAPEALLPQPAVPLRRGDELGRQRVDDAGAHAVEAARGAVRPVLELPAGMQRREDHLQRALAALGMAVDRHPPAVVGDRDRRAVGVQLHVDVAGVAVHRLVDRVVEDLPHQVVQAGRADPADVHAGPLADRIESFEDRDVFRRIGLRHRLARRHLLGPGHHEVGATVTVEIQCSMVPS